jgi:hypothetical protein
VRGGWRKEEGRRAGVREHDERVEVRGKVEMERRDITYIINSRAGKVIS